MTPFRVMAGPCVDLQSDSLVDWISAIGTLGAFVVALLLAGFALRDRRESQARTVIAYTSGGPVLHPTPGDTITLTKSVSTQIDPGVYVQNSAGMPSGMPHGVEIAVPTIVFSWTLQNRSNEMISNVEAELVDAAGVALYRMEGLAVVEPAYNQQFTVITPADGKIHGGVFVRLRFRDAVGRGWTRTSGQRLRRVGRRRS